MAETQTVIIEFITQDEQLDSAIDKLEKTGAVDSKLATAFKQTNAEINKQSAEIKKAAASTTPLKKNLEDVNKATKKFTQDFMTGFNEGVLETLKEAGVSAEEFSKALGSGQTEVEKSSESLRARLKILTQQIAEMKLAGKDGTEQFKALVVEAGNIKDAMGDAAAEIKNAGSDTRTFDNLLGAAQAVAGGFAVAQGAAALFGDENEELQKTLLKVNAVMAILQGLQSVGNALQKEGAIVQLFTTRQKQADAEATGLQIIAQKTYNLVVGQSVGLMRVLKIALAATGVGILVIGLIELVNQFNKLNESQLKAEEQTKNFNQALKEQEDILEELFASFDAITDASLRNIQVQLAYAKAAKKSTEEILSLELDELRQRQLIIQERRNAQIDEIRRLSEFRSAYENALSKIINLEEQLKNARTEDDVARVNKEIEAQKQIVEINKARVERLESLEKQYNETFREANEKELEIQKFTQEQELKSATAFAQARVLLAQVNSKEELNARISAIRTAAREQLANVNLTEGERLKIVADVQRQINDLVFDYERRQLENAKLAIDQKLETVKAGTKSELHFRIEQAKIAAQIELKEQGISAEKRLLIEAQLLKKIQQLRVEFFNKLSKDVLTIEQRGNEARIADLKTSDQERLDLQLENIEIERVIQLSAAKGNAAEEIRINAEAEQKKLQLRKDAIEEAAQYEIDIRTADNGRSSRALQRIINDEKKGLEVRKAAIRQLAAEQIKDIDTRLKALQDEKDQQLISEEEYTLKYKQLSDKRKEINEKTEEDITAKTKEQNKLREEIAFAALNAIATVISGINANQTEQDNQRIDAEKERVADLLEAGAITEDEAKKRNKRIDAEERKLKREQAQREKNLAIFNAVINTAQAITKALASAPPPFNVILAAISAALGAAQIAAISNRPLPKFAKGKKDKYEGPGEIGEDGAELMEHNGQLYLAKKRTLVWLGKDDKVYNPTETKEMLMPVVDKQLMNWQAPVAKPAEMDYDKLAKAMGKHINMPGFNIDEQGFKIWQQEGLSRKNYMDKRYSSK